MDIARKMDISLLLPAGYIEYSFDFEASYLGTGTLIFIDRLIAITA
jgi:hypothetical protein